MPQGAANGAHGKGTTEVIKNNPWAIGSMLGTRSSPSEEVARTKGPESGQREPYVVSGKYGLRISAVQQLSKWLM